MPGSRNKDQNGHLCLFVQLMWNYKPSYNLWLRTLCTSWKDQISIMLWMQNCHSYKCKNISWKIFSNFFPCFIALKQINPRRMFNFIEWQFENEEKALTGVVQWIEHHCYPEGRWFSSQSRHMPGLQARSPGWGAWEATPHWYFPLFLLPFPSLQE